MYVNVSNTGTTTADVSKSDDESTPRDARMLASIAKAAAGVIRDVCQDAAPAPNPTLEQVLRVPECTY